MTVSTSVRTQVEQRAAERCEYCGMHQSLQGGQFHIEHVCPTSRGGTSQLDNLALACPGCNFRKTDHVAAFDSESETTVRLFNPRTDRWLDHFHWAGYEATGLTATGRATVALLDLNHPRRVRIRQAEEMFGLFPPIV
jgi:hypothetical protein